MFFHFVQNNTGGTFDSDLPRHVIIEAANAAEANELAEEVGVYFDGCNIGYDCSCCGDRWYRVDDYDAEEVPMIYGDPAIGSEHDFKIYSKNTPLISSASD